MAKIPQAVLDEQPLLEGLPLIGRGKVRDSYEIPSHPKNMLVVASNRCSIFDFVLNVLIPLKGQVLTAMSCFWMKEIISEICEIDLVAYGAHIDAYLPEPLRGDSERQKNSLVVKKVRSPQVEDIVRLYLTGTGWKSYQADGTVCGHKLPCGLQDGSKLPYAIYTPTTKAEVGHDEHITADSVAELYGVHRERLALQVAQAVAGYAEKCGLILADTKFEFGLDPENKNLILADEKATPDSSRLWDAQAWKKAHAKGKLPASFDKQYVRDWGKGLFIEKDPNGRKREPENPADLEYVSGQVVPLEVVEMTTRIYRYIFWRLTGMKLEVYQREKMGIQVNDPKMKIAVVVGSKSDLRQLDNFGSLSRYADVNVQVLSCHRNTDELPGIVDSELSKADIVIAGAGKAAALPGMLKSHLCAAGYSHIPVIGVAFEGETEKDSLAAKLSIECLPGTPVELDPNGKAYFGPEGFQAAFRAAVEHEFLLRTVEEKPTEVLMKSF